MLKLILCFVISLALVVVLMPGFINYLKKISFNQTVSEYSLKEYQEKASTPIMGGVLFIIVPVLVTLAAGGREALQMDTMVILLTFVGYGLIGFTDDFLIAVKKNNDGLSPRMKFFLQVVLAAVFYLMYHSQASLDVAIPFTSVSLHFGMFYSILVLLMFSGASNAVNLTDGMDGLAAGCTLISLAPFLYFAVRQGKMSVAIFIASLMGALCGYLKYNVKPARIFMGDTGSLSLGAALAAIAMILKMELALVIIGGVFVIETLCVMIQIGSVKIRHKRVFPYTPIHYAFVMKGMGENEVVHRFWLCAAVFALLGFLIGMH
ncbi:MAG: phospho-N-acetylmuramoyl-pentapeptide-transferase [Solobacterium sp.]|nr:phospho-N-acetylmuramoyl-pentapeptide-transferase [Solobacterium sp.]MBR3127711.1 phospho-N-acetylmuramoyl-pentapeptide-transferase [Solobacterium sp.]